MDRSASHLCTLAYVDRNHHEASQLCKEICSQATPTKIWHVMNHDVTDKTHSPFEFSFTVLLLILNLEIHVAHE